VTRYETGRRFEYRVREYLVDNGYTVVRAAGSKGNSKIDLVAIKPGQLLFVQAKSSGSLPPSEWDRITEVARWVDAIPLLAQAGPHRRGIVLTELLGPKRPGRRSQPIRPFTIDAVIQKGE
jgi:Holliday junction resolvase